MNAETLILALIAAAGSIGTVILGVLKAREDRSARIDSGTRQERVDALALVTNDRDFWRAEASKERARADKYQEELFRVMADADHVADVAQAALLAYRTGKAQIPDVTD